MGILDEQAHDLKDGVFIGIREPDTDPFKILLVRHKYGDGKWSLPGGGIRFGELALHAAVREALEETNLHVKDAHQIGTFTLRKKYGLVLLFDAIAWEGMPIIGEDNREISEVGFFTSAGAPKEIYPAQYSLMQVLERYWVAQRTTHPPTKQWFGYLTTPPTIIT